MKQIKHVWRMRLLVKEKWSKSGVAPYLRLMVETLLEKDDLKLANEILTDYVDTRVV